MVSTRFDPVGYKRSTHDQWQAAAAAWRRWQPVIDGWLLAGTDLMLDLAQVHAGARVLDVAAGAGGQTFAAARRVGSDGEVLATDLSENLVRYLEQDAADAGLTRSSGARRSSRPRNRGSPVRSASTRRRSGLPADVQVAVWQEVADALTEFEGPGGFTAPCELLVVCAGKPPAPSTS